MYGNPWFCTEHFPISKPIRTRMSFQILHEDEAVPSYLLRHMCGKLQHLELQGNAVMLIASTRLVGKLVDDPLWF